jgi:predicted HicB family RNase H-like nuclease
MINNNHEGNPVLEGKTDETETSRTIIVRLKIPTHKALRIRVAEEDTSIQQWVEALIERELGAKRSRSH